MPRLELLCMRRNAPTIALHLKEAAAMLSVHPRTMRRWADDDLVHALPLKHDRIRICALCLLGHLPASLREPDK